ncbi:MAG: hypothetical protein JKY93_06545 [Gammaproteobacteria bacterium]|nr:hypothetical protein [Gammaproteobacteria bacterium]
MLAFQLNNYDTFKTQCCSFATASDEYWKMREATLEKQQSMDGFLASVERKAFRMAEIAVNDSEEALELFRTV